MDNTNSIIELPHFERLAAHLVGGDTNNVHGIIVGVINSSRKTAYLKSFGHMSPTSSAPLVDENTTFWGASCTKLLTAICALQILERGEWHLDKPVQELISDFIRPPIISLNHNRSGPQGGPEINLRPARGAVSLRNLLTHTSGLVYEWGNPLLTAWREDYDMSHHVPISEPGGPLKPFYASPLIFEPGHGWSYGGSFDAIGLLIEKLNNHQLGDYMRQHIFYPKGMNSTTFHLQEAPHVRDKLLGTARRELNGELVPTESQFREQTDEDSGGHGIFTSVPDFLQVLGEIVSINPTLLQHDTIVDALFKPHLPEGSEAHRGLLRHHGLTANTINHSLGGVLLMEDGDILPAGTLFWGGMPNIRWFANKDLGVAGIFATQLVPPEDGPVKVLTEEFLKEVMALAKDGKHLDDPTEMADGLNVHNGGNGVNGINGLNGLNGPNGLGGLNGLNGLNGLGGHGGGDGNRSDISD